MLKLAELDTPAVESVSHPTVYIVDDDEAILDLIRRVCSSLEAQVQTFTSATPFLEVVDAQSPGCLILDYKLPDLNGLELLEKMAAQSISLPVIFISGRAEISTAVAALKAGSVDFLEKPFNIEKLRTTTEWAVNRDATQRRSRAIVERIGARLDSLTPRETQVMRLVVVGRANKEVAVELGVSPKTVEVHRANVMQKMRAGSLAELVQMFMQHREATTPEG